VAAGAIPGVAGPNPAPILRIWSLAAGLYEVLALLPERDGEFQYRIKSEREPYQRIVKELELEPI
jgi:hypothetical protein